MIRAALFACLIAVPVSAQGLDDAAALDLAFAASTKWCAEQGGTLERPDAPITRVDLTGDGTADDAIVSEEGAFCGPDHGFLGGSGGFLIHAIVGGTLRSTFAGAWVLQDIAFTVEGEAMPATRALIFARHGSACGSFGAAPCMEIQTWDGEKMISATDVTD